MTHPNPPAELLALSENEQAAMEIYSLLTQMPSEISTDDPDDLAELAGMCFSTAIHLGGIVERFRSQDWTTPKPNLPESVVRDELLPCPFCGVSAQVLLTHDRHNVAFVCNRGDGGCGTRAPYKPNGFDARTAWNTRTPKAELPESVVTDEMVERFAAAYYHLGQTFEPARIRVGLENAITSVRAANARAEGVTRAEINAAFTTEIERVSTLEFNSNQVCRAFYRNLLKRMYPEWNETAEDDK